LGSRLCVIADRETAPLGPDAGEVESAVICKGMRRY
jgi:hypothetical protein